uniref:Granulins domain-containing protein n=1 Tax=Branchiostoma floridae TaxID=7739 RepID=C3YSF6_BRAFL|eukprot:XP_002600645.1 hypothetical protein BRAFLDRAFT_102424 [Branchiostoma floridae]
MRLLIVLLCSLALCSAVPFPKGAHQCPDVCQPEETCCKSNSTLTHGCCPISQGDLTLNWSPKMEVKFRATITCPGGTHDCPENTTCCLTAKGDYGCCPLAKAACCKDHTHCCPSGFKCDESAGKCRQGNRTLPFLEKFAARPRFVANQEQVCPGGKSTCPTTSTCCMLKNGKYGCCPMEKAVCCEDKVHCCPSGFTCAATKCKKGEYSIPLFSKTEAKIRQMHPAKDAKVVTCPDGLSACKDNTTCCKDDTGEYGCCPIPQAECCNDQIHCCPAGFTCQTEKGKCSKGGVVVPLLTKTRADVLSEEVESVHCDDGSACPNHHTCCKTQTGKYGCCPLPKDPGTKPPPGAVVCPDHVSMCPDNNTCCLLQDGSYGCCPEPHWHSLAKPPPGAVVCPDHVAMCTCCLLQDGNYGCCPEPHAVCCSDRKHCCPQGYTCDTSQGKCLQGYRTIPWIENTVAPPNKVVTPYKVEPPVNPIDCDEEGKVKCPDKNTCCKKTTGEWGCCPLEKALCCEDKVHCCPHGTVCNKTSGECHYPDGTSQAWVQKTPPLLDVRDDVKDVPCPDGKSACEEDYTCCKNSTGYGCCPFSRAVCCNDTVHCCPQHYTCNSGAPGTCIHNFLPTVPMAKKTASKMVQLDNKEIETDNEILNNVRCDTFHECPANNTCLLSAVATMFTAVLKIQHARYLPENAREKTSAFPGLKRKQLLMLKKFSNIKCDATHECPSKHTCCKLASGQWGCCPLPSAVCCDDHVHCCPEDTTCSVSTGKCEKGELSLPWFEKTSAITVEDAQNVMCDATHECKARETCCKLKSGQWGCCPLPKAVCCDDKVHCCPEGTTCSVSTGKCHKGDASITWFETLPAKSKAVQNDPNIMCDATHECPAKHTCCKLASGQWGCCPLPSAVCCDDHVHCCPEDTTCEVSSGKCKRKDISFPWFEKESSHNMLKKSQTSNVTPPMNARPETLAVSWPLDSGAAVLFQRLSAVMTKFTAVLKELPVVCQLANVTKIQHVRYLLENVKRKDISFPWLEKKAAINVEESPNIKCDSTHECKATDTCCKLKSGQWGCCPLPKAVCCDDKVHCCPEGTTCSVSTGKCHKGDVSITWFEKVPSIATVEEVSNVKCDATHECPSKHTCCKLASGQWGCCPLPSAVCCDDHVHCCPEEQHARCRPENVQKEEISFPWLEKKAAINVEESPNIKCDSTHECKATDTCCKLKSGQWGCCPLPKAVCCDDKVHCCPEGTTCSVSTGKCNKGDISMPCAVCCDDHVHCCPEDTTCEVSSGKCKRKDSTIPWFEKVPAITTVQEVSNVKCDATHECPSKHTCCKLASGQWGCCPLPSAVCCNDHVHCCPEGTTCSVSTGKCEKGEISLPWFEKASAITVVDAPNVMCDATHECKAKETCCKLASGQWGCCPLPKAVCCNDHVHCCPEDTTCSVSSGKCTKEMLPFPGLRKSPAKNVKNDQTSNVMQPMNALPNTRAVSWPLDSGAAVPYPVLSAVTTMFTAVLKIQHAKCHPENAREKNLPFPGLRNAVCCNDHVHCCPEDTTCEVSSGKCKRKESTIPWFEKVPVITKVKEVSSVKCDATHECPSKHTCCKLASGQWGCCPLPSAVCCDDHVHCCPEDTTCEVSSGKCKRKDISIPWFEKVPAITTEEEVSNVKCDATHECPSKHKCCKLASGQWGCCPLPSAVCCNDHVHCCPEGTTCSVSTGKCEKGDISLAWFEKTSAITVEDAPNVMCDATHECKAKETCCKLKSGQWGCCPLPKAVCCDDKVHCCPEGTTCSVSTGKCHKGDDSITWFEKLPAKTVQNDQNIMCDATHECPSKHTCCKLASGQWGCCPLPSAVCCDDHVHCCPEDTTCEVSSGKCKRREISFPWLEKTSAITVEDAPNVMCDATHECKARETCCKLASGQWGCCPLPKAVCCNDHVHCCPEGTTCSVSTGKCHKVLSAVTTMSTAVPKDTTCEVSSGKCKRKDITISWFEKVSAMTTEEVSNVKCDATHECPSKHTCCKLASGQWGCCPLPSAVCCNDHVHCCPEDTTCEVSSGKCKRKDSSIPWFEKIPAITTAQQVSNVKCDATHECPTKHTCCKLASGQWGCCPLPSAVCCNDHVHCCPEDTTCSVSTGKCEKGELSLPWFEKTSAITVEEAPNVMCDATHECKARETCCKLKSGQWGCCPLPKAVCCDDKVHCCPEGTTCSVSTGKCHKGDISIPWFEKKAALTVDVEKTPCPGGKQECATNYTCCQRGATPYTWGCCDFPNAVCCPDRKTCCPKGYHCDPSRATCFKSESDDIVVAKQLAIPDTEQAEVGNVICPGGEYQCPEKTTCCVSPSGTFGCCPVPEAVCCVDGVHCCPKDHTCDPSSQTCKSASGQLPWQDKLLAKQVQVKDIKCGSSTSTCGDTETCCKMATGQWGCCPMPKAVCCEDHLHCCPRGYKCDMPTSTCIRGNDILPMAKKRPADIFNKS